MLDPSIIMRGQAPNVLGAASAGLQLGQQHNDIQQQNALAQYLQQSGGDVLAGNGNALNGLAQMGPAGMDLARQVQGRQQDVQARDRTFERGVFESDRNHGLNMAQEARLTRAEERQIQEQAARMSAEERAASAARIESAVAQGLSAQTAEQWDAVVGAVDPSLVGQFENREVIAGKYLSIAEQFKRMDAASEVEGPQSLLGKFYADQRGGWIPEGAAPPVSGNNVTINNLPDGGGVTDKFYETLDTDQADMFGALLNQGAAIPAKLAQVDELEAALKAAPTGGIAAFKSFAGGYGINTEGLSELQAAEAIISRLVPAQRQPGSGPMSDADLELYKKSLPRIINTAEGNRQIVQTMRGLVVYEQKQAEIANRVASRELTPAEGRRELMALDNPLRIARGSEGDTNIQGTWTDMGNGIRIRPVN